MIRLTVTAAALVALIVFADQASEETEPDSSPITAREPVYSVLAMPDGESYLAVQRNDVVVAGTMGAAAPTSFGPGSGRSGETPHPLPVNMLRACRLALSPVDGRVLVGSRNGTVGIWDPSDECAAAVIGQLAASVTSVGFSPDGRQLCAGDGRGQAGIWDSESFAGEILQVCGPDQGVKLAFSSDSRHVVVRDWEGSLTVWDVDRQSPVRTLPCGEGGHGGVCCSRQSPIAAWSGTMNDGDGVQVWNVETGQRLWREVVGPPVPYSSSPSQICFSPDGRLLAFASGPTLLLFEATTGAQVAGASAPGHCVTALCFASNGGLLSSGFEGSIRCWDSLTLHERWNVPTAQLAAWK